MLVSDNNGVNDDYDDHYGISDDDDDNDDASDDDDDIDDDDIDDDDSDDDSEDVYLSIKHAFIHFIQILMHKYQHQVLNS